MGFFLFEKKIKKVERYSQKLNAIKYNVSLGKAIQKLIETPTATPTSTMPNI